MKTIRINNETYILEKDVKEQLTKKNIKPTKKQIVVLNRGWVVIGDYSEKGDDYTLANASVIRKWGTTQGLGELAEKGKMENPCIEHCSEPSCPECNIAAYKAGQESVNEKVLHQFAWESGYEAGERAERTRITSTQAFDVLQDYLQTDEDGVMVLVSRQAVDEIVNLINSKE